MFIITDQLTFRVGRQCGFACAGKTEKYGHIALLSDVSRAVHGGNTFQWQQIIHDGEQPFFHLAAIPGASDELHFFGQVKGHKVFRIQPLFLPVRVGAFCTVHHDKIRFEIGKTSGIRADKHVFNEMSLPGHFGNKPHAQAGFRVSATQGIHNE